MLYLNSFPDITETRHCRFNCTGHLFSNLRLVCGLGLKILKTTRNCSSASLLDCTYFDFKLYLDTLLTYFHKYIAKRWLPPFSLIRDFGKQNTRGKRFQNFRRSCLLSTDRFEIHQSQPLV